MSESEPTPSKAGASVEAVSAGTPSSLAQPAGFDPFTFRYWIGRYDLRPLALFRAAFGIFLFYDLCDLFPSMRMWFSDEGVFPRSQFLPGPDHWARANRFSLLDSFGTIPMVYVYWAIAATAVICLAMGYKTRVAAVVTWLIMVSFDERLPPLYDGSDTVIRMLSLWLMFIPSGNVWSVDAVKAEKAGKPLPKEGTAFFVRIIQLQLGWIYLNTALCKFQGHYWQNGTALHYALRLTHVFARPWADKIADFLPLVMLMTYGTLVIECETLLFLNFPSVSILRLLHKLGLAKGTSEELGVKIIKVTRALAILGVCTLHVGIMLTINVGLFSYLMPLTMFALFEPEWAQAVWNWVKRVLPPGRAEAYRNVALAMPAPAGFDPPLGSYFSQGFKQSFQRFGSTAVGIFFLLCTWYSLPKYLKERVPLPPIAPSIVEAMDSWNSWDMFSPDPLSDDYHLTGPGQLEDGTRVDVLGHPEGDVRPIWFSRWYKYFENVISDNQQIKLEWGRFMCREQINNRRPGEKRLYKWTLYKDDQLIPPIGQPWPPVGHYDIWDHQCLDDVPPPPAAPIANESALH